MTKMGKSQCKSICLVRVYIPCSCAWTFWSCASKRKWYHLSDNFPQPQLQQTNAASTFTPPPSPLSTTQVSKCKEGSPNDTSWLFGLYGMFPLLIILLTVFFFSVYYLLMMTQTQCCHCKLLLARWQWIVFLATANATSHHQRGNANSTANANASQWLWCGAGTTTPPANWAIGYVFYDSFHTTSAN